MIESLLDRDVVPDAIIRMGIRRVVAARLREQRAGGRAEQARRRAALLEQLRREPVALNPALANAQHYELPAGFFELVLGPHLKYSSAWWPPGVATLAEAERQMLDLTLERAHMADRQRILELGCGWGSLTLHLASRFQGSRIVAVSNSRSQREYITAQAKARALDNVTVITADVNEFDIDERFDRIVSVEMLEHVRNYPALFSRIHDWLEPGGRFFAHVFSHREFAYTYETEAPSSGHASRTGASDWMARHFFTGGMMPSHDLFLRVQNDLVLDEQWRLDGGHYQKTAEAWLRNFDDHAAAVDEVLAGVYGHGEVTRWRARWRIFFMACAELFGYGSGEEWGVSHYRFRRRES